MAKGNMAMPMMGDPYQASSDARTLMDAHKIRKTPARHKAAKGHAMAMMAAMDHEDNPKMGGDSGKDESKEKS